jgi:DNA-binding IclR family transcriptional regulator
MRPRVSGMNEVDNIVLEFFEKQDDGVFFSPALVHWNLAEVYEATDKSKETIARRMRKLVKRGLLVKDGERGYYRITEKGFDYLNGNLTAEDLKLPDEK